MSPELSECRNFRHDPSLLYSPSQFITYITPDHSVASSSRFERPTAEMSEASDISDTELTSIAPEILNTQIQNEAVFGGCPVTLKTGIGSPGRLPAYPGGWVASRGLLSATPQLFSVWFACSSPGWVLR